MSTSPLSTSEQQQHLIHYYQQRQQLNTLLSCLSHFCEYWYPFALTMEISSREGCIALLVSQAMTFVEKPLGQGKMWLKTPPDQDQALHG